MPRRNRTIDLAPEREKVILVEMMVKSRRDGCSGPLEELFLLARTADLEVLDMVVQYRERINPATCIGRGKVTELAGMVRTLGADTVVFDNELTPAQVRNLEKALDVKVVDRSELILDIFARHARTGQARIQVELAQLEYSLPRLRRLWSHLSRIKGGIGLRGPGEKQLEVDRRLVRKQIGALKRKLREIENNRQRQVAARSEEFTVSLVGYTNAGKSTLMNALTDAGTKVEDELFATLDTMTRVCNLGGGRSALLSDTVGFIRNLPHHLIASFHATLEEAARADLLVHVVDASHPDARSQISVVNGVLGDLDCGGKATILVLNKTDLISEMIELRALLNEYPGALAVSALQGKGLSGLKQRIVEAMEARFLTAVVRCRQTDGKVLARLHAMGKILEEDTGGRHLVLKVRISEKNLVKLQQEGGLEILKKKTGQADISA